MLPTSTHERYLYPLFAFAAPLLVRTPRLIPAYALLSATFMLNLLAINPPSDSPFWDWHKTDFAVFIAAINVAIYVGMIALMLTRTAIALPRPALLPAFARARSP
jgi:hypothetical protein